MSDAFLREVGRAVSQQVKNISKLAKLLSVEELARVSSLRGYHEDQVTALLFLWRDSLREDKERLRLRLSTAGVNFDLLLSNIPAGQSGGKVCKSWGIEGEVELS